MALAKCQRCSKKDWNLNKCNYCGKIVCITCLKAMKHVKKRHIGKLYICKGCWSVMDMRKKYRNDIPVSL